ncbi:TetR/AcrR family transcriptional regulator [Nonomuraea glycinis]|nr:TetR/AcrR family transcriptional regulator [Nonomuraea glycinis]MCA2176848.1 TetR/AcrR family transcriptional regulator [Nonomuraea glycinis]
MSDKPTRRRAPGMSPEERRAMIVAAALPLVAEHGTAVTTSQIARAAAIGEATIFRVFNDKEELLDACLAEAIQPDHVVKEIASIPLDQPLASRLAETVEALSAHLDRVGTVIGALHAGGHGRGRQRDRPQPGGREASMQLIKDAVTDLIEPDAESLRLPPDQIATIFLSLQYSQRRGGTPSDLPVPDLVEVFLHGAMKPST